MIPRFLRTFLIISALIILTTLYVLYPLHAYPLKAGPDGVKEDLMDREDHWDKGGVEPDYTPRVDAGVSAGDAGTGGQRIVELELEFDRDPDLNLEEAEEEGLTITRPPKTHQTQAESRPTPRPSSTYPHSDPHSDDNENDDNNDNDSDNDDDKEQERTKTSESDLKELEHGNVIMSRLGNATAKAELGRAAWKLLHTMTLRFPEHPTPSERSALKSYMHLFARLYPCGECAEEFQGLLREFPVQTSSRKSASLWLCSMHNLVNARLGKEEFDCNMLEGTYDCGCGEEAEGDESGLEKEKLKVGEERVEADREEVKTAPRVEMW